LPRQPEKRPRELRAANILVDSTLWIDAFL
jgi:hypothetical protein